MLFYYIIAFVIVVLGFALEKKNRKLYACIVFAILTVIVGLRHYTIGVDTPNYVGIFNTISSVGVSQFMDSWLEIGFLYFNIFISKFTDSYTIFLLIIAIITNFSICKFIEKYSHNMTMSFLLIILTRMLFNEMNIMRQCLSVALFLISFDFIKKRNFIKFLIIISISSLIHKSSILLIPIYFLYGKKLGTRHKICLISLTAFIYVFFYIFFIRISTYFGTTYEQYVENFYGSNKIASVLSFFINLFILLLFFMINKIEKTKNNEDEIFLYNCQYILTLISFLCIKMSILSRVTVLFDVLILVSLPNYIRKIRNLKIRAAVYFGVVCFFLLSTSIILLYRPEWYKVIPYRFFWD